MTLIPIALFWVLLLIGLAQQNNRMHLYMLFATMAMTSFAVVPTSISGGLTLTGPPVIAAAMIFKSLFRIGAIGDYLNSAVHFRILGVLTAFWVVACAVTFLAPRYFMNQVEVIPMKLKTVGLMGSDLLSPTKQNISQMLYITISVMSVFMFSHLFRSPKSYQQMISAFRFGAFVTVFTGGLDLLSTRIPITPLLDMFRTGGYAMMTDKVVNGYKRVVGLMPEAAAFGGICLFFLCFLYFSRFLLRDESLRSKAIHYGIMLALAAMLVLSMSSSAYLGLGVLGLTAVLEWCYRRWILARNGVLKTGLSKEFLICISCASLILFVIVAMPPIRDELHERIDRLIFSKADSISYEERSMWNAVSLQSLWDTSGIGCGLGGTRASNRLVSVFSNTGTAGGILFYGFLIQTLMRRPAANSPEGTSPMYISLIHAAVWSFPPFFAFDFLVATTPDFGLSNAWIYGTVIGIWLQSIQVKTTGDPIRNSQFPSLDPLADEVDYSLAGLAVDGRLTNLANRN